MARVGAVTIGGAGAAIATAWVMSQSTISSRRISVGEIIVCWLTAFNSKPASAHVEQPPRAAGLRRYRRVPRGRRRRKLVATRRLLLVMRSLVGCK
ncbi:hypothetical protein CWO89_28165 [Bradyrhizobium sp. Leo170]|nr:hypothetical protein CWO90_29805 [Bradyrhizobium sp. Leo121]TAI62731.1 hypothetical protein CWO89_28165 [Bradyrhizobium sp. Leo170]